MKAILFSVAASSFAVPLTSESLGLKVLMDVGASGFTSGLAVLYHTYLLQITLRSWLFASQ